MKHQTLIAQNLMKEKKNSSKCRLLHHKITYLRPIHLINNMQNYILDDQFLYRQLCYESFMVRYKHQTKE